MSIKSVSNMSNMSDNLLAVFHAEERKCGFNASVAFALAATISFIGVYSLPVFADTASGKKRVSIADFQYVGAFALPDRQYGDSSANWSEGIIEVNGDSLFFVGHRHHDAIAEFTIPPLTNTVAIDQLRYAEAPKQAFTKVIDKVPGGNPEKLDQISGLELINGQLVANAIEYYDAPADNRQTTFTINDASAISSSAISGFYSLKGEARAAGWISSVPVEWQKPLGCTHISGSSSGGPIIARHSVGPSAFCLNLQSIGEQSAKKAVKTKELLGFELSRPLNKDLLNESGKNNLWTHLSQARYGFIIPGTSTYATFGYSGGHNSLIGYKLSRPEGYRKCHGYCASDPHDVYNYYWLWDVNELLKVKRGRLAANKVKPYESGKLDVPFQTDQIINHVGGGSYDAETDTLYLSVLNANNTLGRDSNPAIIVAYKVAVK